MKSSQPVMDMELRPKDEPRDLAPVAESSVSVFERLARDPSVDVDKLERLMQMHERVTAREAEGQFNAAMTAAQAEMRSVAVDAYNPQTRSRYASYEALDAALRPIYTRHGFGPSFNTSESPLAEHVRILCYVSHLAGHSRTYHIDMPADGKGAKGGDVMTKTHATGSAVSYGMRYLLKMIFNVATGEGDDDGNRAAPTTAAVTAPDGFDNWLTDLTAVADEGLPALQAAWNKSRREHKEHLTKTAPRTWNDLKTKAAKVKAVTS